MTAALQLQLGGKRRKFLLAHSLCDIWVAKDVAEWASVQFENSHFLVSAYRNADEFAAEFGGPNRSSLWRHGNRVLGYTTRRFDLCATPLRWALTTLPSGVTVCVGHLRRTIGHVL